MTEAATQRSATEGFDQRAARAVLLADQAEVARAPLQFVARLCSAQSQATRSLEQRALSGALGADAETVLSLVEPVMRMISDVGPTELAAAAQERLGDDAATARTRLHVYWRGDTTAREDYLSRALLQPYAEVLRARNIAPDREHRRGHCPFCGSKPWISARKPGPDADSGFRYLGCSLCGLEWNFNRICCPSCFDEDPYKLPIFQSETHPTARIEACETCRRYVKSIDLTRDARMIPAIDDLVSLSIDLWAADEGFTRLEPGLAGL